MTHIRPFTEADIPAAAALLAERHRADAQREPRLPAPYAAPAGTEPLVRALFGRSSGVVAEADGRVAAYLLGAPDLDWGGRAILIPLEGHAVSADDAVEVYREMYAAASPRWLDEGYFQHTINVPAGDEASAAAFNSLGFGQMLAFGLRDTAPVEGANPAVAVRRATEADTDPIRDLMTGLGRYNSLPPLYRPYVANPTPDWPRLPTVQKQLVDEACSYWLAFDGDQPTGIMIFTPPDPTEHMVSPQDAVYLWIAYVRPDSRISGTGKALVDAGLAWARERGHQHCTVGWFTTNITGARFWTGRNYRPVMHRLERRLDERISWARVTGS